ncbi:uncharacterized protein STEHIDRAFT_167831 [Stereum hirsutum FP-91666 SS1]|uniref:uncharacterized protein n=1 Tax=Stereum hirsutum (strain FP-91666) TaxID=721885 RepID=UPI000440D6C3|nr:uncharacterized protein STEHIDRAFT_167831 [Stereum hirsutum FP-91666 SS1]EIM88565.1 hypothetical protein STEHIDRAFT_167831 [Stereum hirsutum FP-91666 SS1]
MHCRRRQVRCARSESGGTKCQRCERMNLDCEYIRASEMQTPPRGSPLLLPHSSRHTTWPGLSVTSHSSRQPSSAMLPTSQAAHHFDQSLASYAQSHHARHTNSPGNVHHAPYGSFNGYSSGHITHSTSATPPQFSLSQSNLPWTSQPTPELDAAHYGTAQYTDVEDSKAWYIPDIASTEGASRMHASPQPVTWVESVWRSNDTPVGPNAGSHSTQHSAPFYGTQGTNPGYSYDPYTAMGYSSSNNA